MSRKPDLYLLDSFDHSDHSVNNINLSTSSSASSSALLSNVRAQRLAREAQRRQDAAAIIIQKVWRRRREEERVKRDVLEDLEAGRIDGLERRAGALVFLLRGGSWLGQEGQRKASLLVDWFRDATKVDGGRLAGVEARMRNFEWMTTLGILSIKAVELIATEPTSDLMDELFLSLERLISPLSYDFLDSDLAELAKQELLDIIGRPKWVEELVTASIKLIALNLPKKKHPSLTPIICLLTAPLALGTPGPPSPTLPILSAYVNILLPVPALVISLPIPALTHLSSHLPLFTSLLPLAAAQPQVLSQGRMQGELGKTYFLANLATFGITGGLLARRGVQGALDWIKVVGTILLGVKDGWGTWIEGNMPIDEDAPMLDPVGSDDEDGDITGEPSSSVPPVRTKSRHVRREPLPRNIGSKILLLSSDAHFSALASVVTSSASNISTMMLGDFARFALNLLNAFRGTARWEGILENLLEGTKGKAFSKRVWREGVRGRWRQSSDPNGWGTFQENPFTPCLMLLTHMYNHYLLITPDDEFFDTSPTSSNPLTIDEALDLASIWRDLAFYGYMTGVAPSGTNPLKGVGTEEARSLMTKGVTRVVERNARKKFASEDFFVMTSHINLQGFIEAAVLEDSRLTEIQNEVEEGDDESLGFVARARRRYTRRQMAFISPRLGLLNNLPMTVPFMTRLEVFRQFVYEDRKRLREARSIRSRGVDATIHRARLTEDGFDQLNDLGQKLKGRINIYFIDKFGTEEAGIDGGGLFKEFMTSLSKDVFNTDRGLWLATEDNELYPNPHSYATEPHQLNWYSFIGRMLGKALYEGILVDVSFADFFLAKWLGRQSYLDDLQSLDKELYRGLTMLKTYPQPEELALNFTVTQAEFGMTETVELVPGGSEIAVTAENRHEYIQLVCKFKLDRQIAAQSRAFFDGLSEIIDAKWLRMFDQQELRQIIGGEETPIDIDDLRAHTEVSGFPNDNTPRMFWKVVKGFDQPQRKALLRFVTSCERPPLSGFSHLQPHFGIRWSSGDTSRLPSASSCFNLLKLPGYQDERQLKSKLLQAITSGAGFDLS